MYWIPTLQENLVVSFLLLIAPVIQKDNLINLLYFMFVQTFMLAYTFIVNDVADKEIDIKAGKIKPIQTYSKKKTALVLGVLAFGSLFIPLWYGSFLVKIVSIVTFLLLTFYSLKPLRFKERGLLGLLVADGAQRSALFLIFGLFISAQPLLIGFFMGWLFLIGFQDELTHQLMDTDADKKSGTRTWTQQVGYQYGKKVLTTFLVASMIFLLIPFLFMDFVIACVIAITLFVFRATTMQFISDEIYLR
jgi:4-hydroxybenzoate polyprenyltransferase